MNTVPVNELSRLALEIRKDILQMTCLAGANGGHLGGALSSAEILAVLYGQVMNVSPEAPENPLRDRFILSKGHVAIAHYAVLAECGFISKEDMLTFEQENSNFPTHEVINPHMGIEISGGSLGYGLSVGVGCALAAKIGGKAYKTYVLMGDGECNEGIVWEAAMFAAKCELDNLIVIIDLNGQQLDGFSKDVMPIYDIRKVFNGFGFHVIETDGHNVQKLLKAFQEIKERCPTVIIANTIKGRGIKSIEGKLGWHHAKLSQELCSQFLEELGESL